MCVCVFFFFCFLFFFFVFFCPCAPKHAETRINPVFLLFPPSRLHRWTCSVSSLQACYLLCANEPGDICRFFAYYPSISVCNLHLVSSCVSDGSSAITVSVPTSCEAPPICTVLPLSVALCDTPSMLVVSALTTCSFSCSPTANLAIRGTGARILAEPHMSTVHATMQLDSNV